MTSQAECESCFQANVLIFTFIFRCSANVTALKLLLESFDTKSDSVAGFCKRCQILALFIAPDGITDFGIAQAKHCNFVFCSFVLRTD